MGTLYLIFSSTVHSLFMYGILIFWLWVRPAFGLETMLKTPHKLGFLLLLSNILELCHLLFVGGFCWPKTNQYFNMWIPFFLMLLQKVLQFYLTSLNVRTLLCHTVSLSKIITYPFHGLTLTEFLKKIIKHMGEDSFSILHQITIFM